MLKDIWVVEYSKQQDCFYITTLLDSTEKNKRIFMRDVDSDYIIIEITDSMDEAYKKLEEIKRVKRELKEMEEKKYDRYRDLAIR